MLNIIKMDLYRLMKTRSMYVIWLIMAGVILLTTYMSKVDMDYIADAAEDSQIESQLEDEDTMQLGMAVSIPTEPGQKVTIYDEFMGNTQGKAIALFIVIFVVLFATADSNSGYIKNIGGQVKHRRDLILSKTLAILVFTVLTMAVFVLVQAVATGICFGYIEWGDAKSFGIYFLLQTILHFALALICMTVANLIRNNVVSMIFAICLCMNVMIIFYGLIDKLVHKLGQKDFSTMDYTVTGKISMLPMEITGKESMSALVVSVVFILIMTILSSVIFEKRDIV